VAALESARKLYFSERKDAVVTQRAQYRGVLGVGSLRRSDVCRVNLNPEVCLVPSTERRPAEESPQSATDSAQRAQYSGVLGRELYARAERIDEKIDATLIQVHSLTEPLTPPRLRFVTAMMP